MRLNYNKILNNLDESSALETLSSALETLSSLKDILDTHEEYKNKTLLTEKYLTVQIGDYYFYYNCVFDCSCFDYTCSVGYSINNNYYATTIKVINTLYNKIFNNFFWGFTEEELFNTTTDDVIPDLDDIINL